MTNESNAGHMRSFVRLPNVSSQFYTFSCLYLLEKKCTRLKTAVWFFALCAKRSFLSRCVKTIDGSPCWISQFSTNFFADVPSPLCIKLRKEFRTSVFGHHIAWINIHGERTHVAFCARNTYVMGNRWKNMAAKLRTDRSCGTLW